MATPPNSSAPEAKKRRRPAKSCEQCRQRKIKCDLEEPCGPCIRARASLHCSYSPETIRSEHTLGGDTAAAASHSKLRYDSYHAELFGPLETTLLSTPGQYSQNACEPTNTSSLAFSGDLRDGNGRSKVTGGLGLSIHNAEEMLVSAQSPNKTITTSAAQGQSHLTAEPLTDCLRLTEEKERIFHRTHWSQTAAKFKLLAQLNHKGADLLSHDERVDLKKDIDHLRHLRRTIKHRQSVVLHEPVPDLIGTFPTRAVCDELFQAYLRTFEPMYRIVHVPSLTADYIRSWERQQPISTAFSMKLALILTIGTTFYPNNTDHAHLHRLAQVWIHAAQWWLTGPTEKAANNLDGVQVACLLLLARQMTAIGLTNSLCNDIALRLAMTVGLHRDPDKFPALSPFQAEMRRRLWYTALELTLQTTFNLSMPLTVTAEHYDTKPPSNLNDQHITPEASSSIQPLSNRQVSDCSLQRLLAVSLPLRMKVAAMLNGLGQHMDYDAAITVGNELKSAYRAIAAAVAAAIAAFPPRGEDASLQMASFHLQYLEMSFHRYVLMVHRSFVLQARTIPRFYYSRKICLESAMIIASCSYSLKLPSRPSNDLARFMTVVKGPTNSPLSLDVMTMLALELMTQLEEEGTGLITSGSIAHDFAKATRKPIYNVLEHILEQLHQILALGSVSMKRYGYLACVLSQLHAMENGEDVPRAVLARLQECAKQKRPLVETTLAGLPAKASVESLTQAGALAETLSGGLEMGDDFEGVDFDMGFADLFHFPELTGGGLMEW